MNSRMLHLLAHRSAALRPLQRDASCGARQSRGIFTVKGAAARAPLAMLLLSLCSIALADDFASLRADRAAIERVYYNHRLGDKPPFEQALPRETLERLVRDDLRKEAALKKVYGVEITSPILEAEVRRINTTTRAPDMLAEIKAALDNDTDRFARTVARPFVVERLLHERFDKDDNLHAPQRRQAELAREALLAAKKAGSGFDKLLPLLKRDHSNDVSETTWQLGARPEEKAARENANEAEIRRHYGPKAQVLSSPDSGRNDGKTYFEDLPPELQRVLSIQLQQAGAVSAVIEMPGGFLVYLLKERTAETLSAATLSIPKQSYEQWLAEQEY
jgi:hypothetical protein